MAFAREIYRIVKNKIPFQQSEKEADSHYAIIGRTLVRMSNHCTHMDTWEQYFSEYPKYMSYKILSLVFEDYDNTFTEECLHLVEPRKKMIEVDEYVFKLKGSSQFFGKVEINSLIKSLERMQYTNKYVDDTHKGLYYHRISRNPSGFPHKVDIFPGDDYYSKLRKYREWNGQMYESKIYKNMKQNVKRNNESQLRAIVAESVKKVLREGYGQEGVYQTICNLEEDLKTVIANTDNSSSQAFGSPEEKLKMIANQLSHVDENMANQAGATFKKLMEVISELQDLRINLKTYGSKDSYWGHNFKTPNGTVGMSRYR